MSLKAVVCGFITRVNRTKHCAILFHCPFLAWRILRVELITEIARMWYKNERKEYTMLNTALYDSLTTDITTDIIWCMEVAEYGVLLYKICCSYLSRKWKNTNNDIFISNIHDSIPAFVKLTHIQTLFDYLFHFVVIIWTLIYFIKSLSISKYRNVFLNRKQLYLFINWWPWVTHYSYKLYLKHQVTYTAQIKVLR